MARYNVIFHATLDEDDVIRVDVPIDDPQVKNLAMFHKKNFSCAISSKCADIAQDGELGDSPPPTSFFFFGVNLDYVDFAGGIFHLCNVRRIA